MSDLENAAEGNLLLYHTQEGVVRIEVLYESETFWLNQKKIAELFGVDVRTISEHLRNIFATNELDEPSVLRKIRTTAADGKNYLVNFYNLDAIISVGYRVNSTQATRLGCQARRLPEIQRIRSVDQRRQGFRRSGQTIGRAAVRDIPHPARPSV